MTSPPDALAPGTHATSARGGLSDERSRSGAVSIACIASQHTGVEGLCSQTWERLFSGHPDSFELVSHIAQSGFEGIELSTVQVRMEGDIVMVFPLFLTRIDLAMMIDRPWANTLSRVFPGLMKPRLLGIGLVEGEWGAVGELPGLSDAARAAGWQAAMREIHAVAARGGATLITMLELGAATQQSLPEELRRRFAQVDTTPCAQLALPFRDLDGYLATLSRSMRSKLRRRLRDAAGLRVERTTRPGTLVPRMYELYQETVARSELKLGVQRECYFGGLCDSVPGAHYVLYYEGERLIAFNALIETGDALIDKYFCMEETRGRELHLYSVSWLENVRYAIERKIPLYHAGPGAPDTKSHFRCSFVDTVTLFRHTNPVAQAILAYAARSFARRSTQADSEGEPKE